MPNFRIDLEWKKKRKNNGSIKPWSPLANIQMYNAVSFLNRLSFPSYPEIVSSYPKKNQLQIVTRKL